MTHTRRPVPGYRSCPACGRRLQSWSHCQGCGWRRPYRRCGLPLLAGLGCVRPIHPVRQRRTIVKPKEQLGAAVTLVTIAFALVDDLPVSAAKENALNLLARTLTTLRRFPTAELEEGAS